MVTEQLKNFISSCKINQILNLEEKNIIESLAKDENFINLIVWLTSVDPYNNEIAEKFYKANAITSLPHLKILKTSLNLSTDKFFLEVSNLIKPFHEKTSDGWRDLSDKLSETKLGKTKLINGIHAGGTIIDVDSTVGFGVTGTLISGKNTSISYTSKSINLSLIHISEPTRPY